MDDIIFKKLVVTEAPPSILRSFAACYQEVFAADPWGEWLSCLTCGASYGINDKPSVEKSGYQHCGQPLTEYWPQSKVIASLEENMRLDGSCWVAEHGDRVVAFCYAYALTPKAFEDRFLISLDMSSVGNDSTSFIYQDEIGVLPQYREKKLAKELNGFVLGDMSHKGYRCVVAITRRNPLPSVTYGWLTQKLGYKILAEYPPQDGRVVLGRTIHNDVAPG